ncbi:hypothetical protein MY5147_005830 [Beauveria neobassiana]
MSRPRSTSMHPSGILLVHRSHRYSLRRGFRAADTLTNELVYSSVSEAMKLSQAD